MDKQEALQEFYDLLKEKYFHKDGPDCSLSRVEEPGNLAGGSLTGADLYKLIAADGSILCFIKGDTLEPEQFPYFHLLLPACKMLQLLPLRRIKFILPFEQKLSIIDQTQYQLTASRPAPGRCVTEYLQEFAEGSLGQDQTFEVIERVSKGLGELNNLSTHNSKNLPLAAQRKNDLCINAFRLFVEEHPKWFPFSLSEFEERFAPYFLAAHEVPFILGYIHGDGNLTNVFYDKEKKLVYLIDSLAIFNSIQPQGGPKGNIAHEYCYCRRSFEIFGVYFGLDSAQIQAMDAIFQQNYPLSLPPVHLYYYDLLTYMAWTIIAYKTGQKKNGERQRIRLLIDHLAGRIANLLSGPHAEKGSSL